MNPPAIRAATPGDAPALAELRYEFRAALDPVAEDRDQFLTRCARWMRDRLATGRWRAWVAEDGGRLLGSVWLQAVEKLPNPVAEGEQYGYISSLFVRKDARAGGLGSRLLATCLAACDTERFDAVFLWPTPRSRSLYLRHGFRDDTGMLERRTVPRPPHGGAA